ncbi:MAG: hypothetical protein RSA84_25850 [Acinetobacter sp.]
MYQISLGLDPLTKKTSKEVYLDDLVLSAGAVSPASTLDGQRDPEIANLQDKYL